MYIFPVDLSAQHFLHDIITPVADFHSRVSILCRYYNDAGPCHVYTYMVDYIMTPMRACDANSKLPTLFKNTTYSTSRSRLPTHNACIILVLYSPFLHSTLSGYARQQPRSCNTTLSQTKRECTLHTLWLTASPQPGLVVTCKEGPSLPAHSQTHLYGLLHSIQNAHTLHLH